MESFSDTIVWLFAAGTLFGQIIAFIAVGLLLGRKFLPKNKNFKKISNLIADNYVPVILILSAVPTIGSLAFSEVLSFVPCQLCWYQRVLMYPISLISFVALLTNDTNIKKYVMPLSIIGILIASYHILLQTFPQVLQCTDEVAKCSAVEFAEFGYITIPVMAFTGFLLIILAGLFRSKK